MLRLPQPSMEGATPGVFFAFQTMVARGILVCQCPRQVGRAAEVKIARRITSNLGPRECSRQFAAEIFLPRHANDLGAIFAARREPARRGNGLNWQSRPSASAPRPSRAPDVRRTSCPRASGRPDRGRRPRNSRHNIPLPDRQWWRRDHRARMSATHPHPSGYEGETHSDGSRRRRCDISARGPRRPPG